MSLNEEILLKCTKCGKEKPLEGFHKAKRELDRYGRRHECKECRSDRFKKDYRNSNSKIRSWIDKNKEQIKKTSSDSRYKARFGLTSKDVYDMHIERDFKCDICKTTCDRLFVDHDHKTGKIRGLLCRKCNSGLGMLNDSLDCLSMAIKYLKGGN